MNKIFQIGFNRCGTRSIFQFFKKNCTNNLKCLHWERGKLALEIYRNLKRGKKLLEGPYSNHDVYTDMEAFLSFNNEKIVFFANLEYKLFDKQYPDSKFILNTRNIKNWIASRKRHYGDEVINFFKEYYKTSDIEKLWKEQWNEHHEEVVDYFKGTNKLLIFNIEKDKGDKIVRFFSELNFKNNNFLKIN